jgi:natural product precursor
MKLDRIKLNENVDLLNDQEMKMMKGGYGAVYCLFWKNGYTIAEEYFPIGGYPSGLSTAYNKIGADKLDCYLIYY